jgi:hypothetical protein
MHWFPGWLMNHIQRHALIGLPSVSVARVMYEAWRVEFERMGVTEAAADAASLALMKRGKHYKSDHYAMLLGLLSGSSSSRANDAETAERMSRDCVYCSGSGRTVVFDDRWGAHHAACCVCEAGRFYLAAWSPKFRPIDLRHILQKIPHRVVRGGETFTVTFHLVFDPHEDSHAEHVYQRPRISRRPDGRDHPGALPPPRVA